jgi:hypothetical protein
MNTHEQEADIHLLNVEMNLYLKIQYYDHSVRRRFFPTSNVGLSMYMFETIKYCVNTRTYKCESFNSHYIHVQSVSSYLNII